MSKPAITLPKLRKKEKKGQQHMIMKIQRKRRIHKKEREIYKDIGEYLFTFFAHQHMLVII